MIFLYKLINDGDSLSAFPCPKDNKLSEKKKEPREAFNHESKIQVFALLHIQKRKEKNYHFRNRNFISF
jgi:hypothetical protein